MEIDRIKVSLIREKRADDEIDSVKLLFSDLEDISITLTESNSLEIEKVFNKIFDYIIENEKLIKFDLEDEQRDLFHEVAEDIVQQLNSEIYLSEPNFEKLIELFNENEN